MVIKESVKEKAAKAAKEVAVKVVVVKAVAAKVASQQGINKRGSRNSIRRTKEAAKASHRRVQSRTRSSRQ